MLKKVVINEMTLQIDTASTREYYSTATRIVDHCDCDACAYYVEVVTKEPFEIFDLLSEMGVDLEKNTPSAQEGVWCVRDTDGTLIHCDQECQVFGVICGDCDQVTYSKFERGYRINARFRQNSSGFIHVFFQFDGVPDENVIIKFP